ncbi:MAG: winged helix-turn-helix domain-containing protein [Steroidobacteraceae bacterium]
MTRFRLGDLEVDTARARVTRDGTVIPLPKLSFDLLVAMIEIAPAVATTDLLLDRVWTGLVVNPETVSQRIKLLRSALGDDPRRPRYIAVERGRGYSLVPAVERIEATADDRPAEPARAPAPAPAAKNRPVLRWAIAGLAALVVLGLGLNLWLRGRDPQPEIPPVTAATERSIAVLPFTTLTDTAGDRILALGVAEALLHQLAGLRDLIVIARSSSFALGEERLDARAIGSRLRAHYLLEGSVQRAGMRIRVSAQLIDAVSGAQVWSLQFDRDAGDIFAVQDEIALRVAQALELSLETRAAERLAGQGTTNFDAYFEYLQARSLLREGRIADLAPAKRHLASAIALDPGFASAYVDLAGVEIRTAEFEMRPDRRERFEVASAEARRLIDRAIALDPDSGSAWLQRAYLRAFTDLAGAEADYRKGLALSPNNATGHEGLAAVLYQDPRRHDEALAELDRARRLDPLEPRYDVTRAVLLLYGRGAVNEAESILRGIVERHPRYAPALVRLGELNWCCRGEAAEGIRYLELGLELDPSSEWVLRALIAAYLDVDEPAAAASLARREPPIPVRELPLQLLERDWRGAGETAYAALRDETTLAFDENYVALALRQHARTTGEVDRALAALAPLAGVSWNAQGQPVLAGRNDTKAAVVGMADLLLLQGRSADARTLLKLAIVDMEREVVELRRAPIWTDVARATALAMLGDRSGALAVLEAAERGRYLYDKHWLLLLDPAFESLRAETRFQRLQERARSHRQAERQRLEEYRQQGLVPRRAPGS